MPDFFIKYMTLWGLACLVAIILTARLRSSIELFHRAYWTGLLQPWKVASFLFAATTMVLIAPYTGDPTWDYIDASFMSLLSFTTAPWVVATLFLAIRARPRYRQAYIAVCIWLFSASWSYDLYLVFRDGRYPPTWFPNLFASSVLYLSAGLLWNLEQVPGRGVIFGFMDPNWPAVATQRSFRRVVWYALPFMILVAAMITPFLF